MDPNEAVQAAVEKLITRAKGGGVIKTGESARRLAEELPECGMPVRDIAQLVARRAIAAGVPIQFTPTE